MAVQRKKGGGNGAANYIHYMYSGVNQVSLVRSNNSLHFPTGLSK